MTLPKLIPTVLGIVPELAISQTIQPVTPIQAPPQSLDPVSVFAILLSGTTAIFAIAPRLIEKWFGGAMEARQTKNELHTLITKSQAELELEDERRKVDAANNLSNFYLESARESRQKQNELLMLFVSKELDNSAQQRDQIYEIIETQKGLDRKFESLLEEIRHIKITQKDIMNVLKMKERSSD